MHIYHKCVCMWVVLHVLHVYIHISFVYKLHMYCSYVGVLLADTAHPMLVD